MGEDVKKFAKALSGGHRGAREHQDAWVAQQTLKGVGLRPRRSTVCRVSVWDCCTNSSSSRNCSRATTSSNCGPASNKPTEGPVGLMAKSSSPIRAAGVVLLCRESDGPLVCVLHRPRQGDWSLPEGQSWTTARTPSRPRAGETIEETGCDIVLGMPLPTQHYRVNLVPRRCTTGSAGNAWADRLPAQQGGRRTPLDLPPEPGHRDAELSRRRPRMGRAGCSCTNPLIILRHTDAMRRLGLPGAVDAERPLTSSGMAAARRVSRVLKRSVSARSTPRTRCAAWTVSTLRPRHPRRHRPRTTAQRGGVSQSSPTAAPETRRPDPRGSSTRGDLHIARFCLNCSNIAGRLGLSQGS